MNRNQIFSTLNVLAVGAVGALAQTVTITNSAPGAGHLTVNVDAYGSYGNFNAAYVDSFEPTGSARNSPTFSSGIMLFSGQDRVALSDMPEMNTTYTGGTWTKIVTSAVVNAGAAAANSVFEVRTAGGAPLLSVALAQVVSPAVGGTATLNQRYAFTNISGGPLNFEATRTWDIDLVWDGSFTSDWVGAFSPTTVYSHEPGNLNQAVALRSGAGGLPHTAYFAGKQGHLPTGGAPAQGFGTDVVIWDNFGLPGTWVNYVPGVGYSTTGSAAGGNTDAYIGSRFNLSLVAGATGTIVTESVYGAVPEPATMAVLGLGAALLARRRRK